MENLSLQLLFILLIALIIISGFFSASETGMMALNRYRLRHLARAKHKSAVRVSKLLERPDRLLGVILIGNTFANIFASSVATIIGVRVLGDIGILVATLSLTLAILIFSEVAPKTFAASHPQGIAFIASLPLKYLLKLFYPVVWFVNALANGILQLFRVRSKRPAVEHLSSEELSTLVQEAGDKIPDVHQDMLLAILSLENVTVNDIMVPRADIIGIDLEHDWKTILKQLTNSQHTRLPVYSGDIDDVKGMLHLRDALNLLANNKLSKNTLLAACSDIHFVPEETRLHAQLLNFRGAKARSGLVVDEYGDIMGLVTLEDILEEIVGEFTTDIAARFKGIRKQPDGSYLIDGSISIREINRRLNSKFDPSGPKTFSGLIIEALETIPSANICLRLAGHRLEILKLEENTIKLVKVLPP